MREDLFEARFSCRRFLQQRAVPRATVEAILDAARWAPTAGGLEPWRFVVVTDAATRRNLASAAFNQSFLAEAPTVVVVCAVPEESARRYGERGRNLYCLQDTAAATENLMLAATACGLGSCWVGAFDEERTARLLELPGGWLPVAVVPLGEPAQAPPRRSRRPLREITVWIGEPV
ncbi:MAG: nitroreductase family protein [Acidobacteriota bacterium]